MNIIKNILITLTLIFLTWFTISYMEILNTNLESGTIHNWNLFSFFL